MISKKTVKFKAVDFIVIFVTIYLAIMSQEVAIWKVLSDATGFDPEVMRIVPPSFLLSIVTISCIALLTWSYEKFIRPSLKKNRDRIGWWAYVLDANTADGEIIKVYGYYRVRYASGHFYITGARAFQVSDHTERATWKTKKFWIDDTGINMLLKVDVLGQGRFDGPEAYSAFLKLEKINDPRIFSESSTPWRGTLSPLSGARPLGGKFYTQKIRDHKILSKPNGAQLLLEIEPKIDVMFDPFVAYDAGYFEHIRKTIDAYDAGYFEHIRETGEYQERRTAQRRVLDYTRKPERRNGRDRRILKAVEPVTAPV